MLPATHIRLLMIFLFCIAQFSCNTETDKKYPVDPKAKKLADSAYQFVRNNPSDTNNFRKAINLLNQATIIDSNYYSAFRNIISYEFILNDYTGAVHTSKRMHELSPHNPDFLYQLGLSYDLTGDSTSSKIYYERAINEYDNILDTLSDKNAVLTVKGSKAMNLLLLNRSKEGNMILSELIQNAKDSNEKAGYAEWVNKTRSQIISELKNGEVKK